MLEILSNKKRPFKLGLDNFVDHGTNDLFKIRVSPVVWQETAHVTPSSGYFSIHALLGFR